MCNPLCHHHYSIQFNLVYFFCLGLIFFACKKSQQNDILDLVYIEGIHDDPEILRADSFYLKGKLNEAAALFKQSKQDVSKQLYCQARLAEMDYYLRELYGKNHRDQTLDSANLPGPISAIDSFLLVVYDFYSKERLDTTKFNYLWSRVTQQLGAQHYLPNLGNFILGEYFYTMNFNDELLDLHFKENQKWFRSLSQKIYDGYWTNIRLASSETYVRDNIESIVNSNELISDNEWRSVLDEIHLSLAHSSLGYVLYRLDEFEKAFKVNEEAILLSKHTLATPVYQEAIKSQLTVTNFWKKDSLWYIYIEELKQNIDSVGIDYVNYNRHVARLYYERGEFNKAIPYHKLAVEYCQNARHLNFPVLNSLCNLYSLDMEKAGFYEQAINIYHLGDLGYVDSTWTYKDLFDSSRLALKYQFSSLVRYGHIYYSWFLKDKNIDLLNKAEELALLAHSLYFRDVDTRDENSLISFSEERNMVMELLCLIYAEKYFRFNDTTAFHEYHRYSEENRGSIFWKDAKSEWDYDSLLIKLLIEEQKLNSENKHLKFQNPIPHELLEQNLNALRLVADRIREKYPTYYANAFNRETPSIEEIQDSLIRSDATLISFDIIENKIFILWIQKCAEELFKIDLTPLRTEQLETLITWMSTRNVAEASEYELLANNIWTWLIPERIKADENTRWIIIPDGYFHNLNLEALVTDISDSSDDYGSLKWLLLEKEITYSPLIKSTLSYRRLSGLNEKNVVGFSWSDEQTLSALNKTQLPELPGTLKEMKELQNIFPSAKIYSGKKATRKNFINSYSDPGIRLIVLSMHGRANSDKQDDICLFFRGGGITVDTFYGYELLPLVSNVETIMLLACETSKGKSLEGEGNYNLVRYFLANGAQNIISSIWDLSDVTSEGIITQLDSTFTNGNFSKILHQNKISIINDNGPHKQQPWFWAGTVLFE